MPHKPPELSATHSRMKSHTQKGRKQRTLTEILRKAYNRHCRDRITRAVLRQLLKGS